MSSNPKVFPPEAFTEQAFVWAFGILRSRALPPVDQGDGIALVPGLDLANHSGLSSATWTLNNGGLGSVFGGGSGPSMLLRTEQKGGGLDAGAELFMNYGGGFRGLLSGSRAYFHFSFNKQNKKSLDSAVSTY